MDKLNTIEIELRKIYDQWETGNEYEAKDEHSKMFRIGFPEEYLSNGKPMIMYVGQEVRDGESSKNWSNNKKKGEGKDQQWVRRYTELQLYDIPMEGDKKNNSAFWSFARALKNNNYNVLWNNLDKFHTPGPGRIDKRESPKLNTPYGQENLSILQREIAVLKPDIIVFAIGSQERYVLSFAAAMGVEIAKLWPYKPTLSDPVQEITEELQLSGTRVFWCYHPAYLRRKHLENCVVNNIMN